MFVFAIETCGKTVALVQEDNSLILEGFLTAKTKEGKCFINQIPEGSWDGSSPFTARLATSSEELDYGIMYYEKHGQSPDRPEGESVWFFYRDDLADYCKAA